MLNAPKVEDRNVLDGSCDLYVDGYFASRCRCALDFDEGEFCLEHPNKGVLVYDETVISIRNAEFVTQTGVIKADEINISFAVNSLTGRGNSIYDSVLNQTFDAIRFAPIWRFVCNGEIGFQTQEQGYETYLRPGCDIHPIELESNIVLKGSTKGINFISRREFDSSTRISLELALGGPIKIFAKQADQDLLIRLNEWRADTKFRTFFDASENGFFNRDKQAEGIKEIFQKTVAYQQRQPDKGENFRFAVEAFVKARSANSGFIVQMLATLQLLEWLDHEKTINHKKMAELFGIREDVSKAIMIIRNEFFHNPRDATSRVNLLKTVRKAGEAFENCGFDVERLGKGNRDTAVLNYVVSLAGYLLLKEIGADVVPTFYIPGHGEFTP